MKTFTLNDLVQEKNKLAEQLQWWENKHATEEMGNDTYYLSYSYKENTETITYLMQKIKAFDSVIQHFNVLFYNK